MESKMQSITLKNDLSVKEMEDLKLVRTMRANPKDEYSKRPSARACALAQIEEAVMNPGTRIPTPAFAKIAGVNPDAVYLMGLKELERLDASVLTRDFGGSYLLIRPKGSLSSKEGYRLGALRAYFNGEPVSPFKQ